MFYEYNTDNNTDNITNITNNDPNINFNFFLADGDFYRLIIIIFIIVSFLLNIIIIFIICCCYGKKRVFSFSGTLTLIILIVNLLHISSYLINWVIKKEGTNQISLLYGSGNACIFQGFLLIFLSMSQDIIVNIFFAFINSGEKEKKHFFMLFLLLGGFLFPFILTFCFVPLEIIGINEKFCHISKYNLDNKEHIENFNYIIYKSILFFIRGLNFLITFFYIIRAVRYIKRSEKKDKKRLRLISSLFVVFITFFTLLIELIFKILFFIKPGFENGFIIDIYLLLNSVDSILLPFSFLIKHKLFVYLCCCCCIGNKADNNYDYDNETSIKDIDIDSLLKDDNSNKEIEMNVK